MDRTMHDKSYIPLTIKVTYLLRNSKTEMTLTSRIFLGNRHARFCLCMGQ